MRVHLIKHKLKYILLLIIIVICIIKIYKSYMPNNIKIQSVGTFVLILDKQVDLDLTITVASYEDIQDGNIDEQIDIIVEDVNVWNLIHDNETYLISYNIVNNNMYYLDEIKPVDFQLKKP